MTENEERDIRQTISFVLSKFDSKNTTIISGGAKGVDTMAQEIALKNGFTVKPFFPLGRSWKFYKKRNIEIANECDELFCITIHNRTNKSKCYHHEKLKNHEKTAGCYTLKICKGLKKPTQLIVV